MKVAFIGLGVMGFPMAGHLAKAGHEVCVYNRTTAKAQQWLAGYPGRCADTLPKLRRAVRRYSSVSVTTTTCARWFSASRARFQQ